MAFEHVLALVVGERNVAVLALSHPTARLAHDEGRKTASVEEQYHLFLTSEGCPYGVAQSLGEERAVAVAELLHHVHYLHLRQLVRRNAVLESQQRVPALRCVEITFHIRSRRAEHQRRPALRRAHFRHFLRIVARIGFADVTRIVLLVYDDDSDVFKRREYSRSRSHRDLRTAVFQPLPFVVTLSGVQPGVHERDEVAEPCAEKSEYLRSERDLRHEHYSRFACREHPFYHGHVDFRLAAARDSVQQEYSLSARYCVNRGLLVVRQRHFPAFARQRTERHPRFMHRALFGIPLFAQSVHRSRAETLRQHGEILPSALFEKFKRFALPGRAFQGDCDRFFVHSVRSGKKNPLELRIPFLPEFGRNEQPEHVDVTEIVFAPHSVHERQLLRIHGSVQISCSFQRGEIRLLFLPDHESDGVASCEFHRDAAAERDVVPFVIEGPVYLRRGYVHYDFKHHSRRAPRPE